LWVNKCGGKLAYYDFFMKILSICHFEYFYLEITEIFSRIFLSTASFRLVYLLPVLVTVKKRRKIWQPARKMCSSSFYTVLWHFPTVNGYFVWKLGNDVAGPKISCLFITRPCKCNLYGCVENKVLLRVFSFHNSNFAGMTSIIGTFSSDFFLSCLTKFSYFWIKRFCYKKVIHKNEKI
jgi:hypothetical protein